MPQKGLKKDDVVRRRREKISSKFFPFFPDHKPTFIGNRAIAKENHFFFSVIRAISDGLPKRIGKPLQIQVPFVR